MGRSYWEEYSVLQGNGEGGDLRSLLDFFGHSRLVGAAF